MKRYFSAMLFIVMLLCMMPFGTVQADDLGSIKWKWIGTLWVTDASDWYYPARKDLEILCSYVMEDIKE